MKPIILHDSGDAVLDIQHRLHTLGLTTDGDDIAVFGEATQRAVKMFQQRRGLTADGIVGDDTWLSLYEAGFEFGDRVLYQTRPSLRGDDVRDLQQRLNRLGFDAGYVDGVFGPKTFEAVRDFQLNVGLTVDGIAGRNTMDLLRRLHRQHQSSPAFAVRERETLRHRYRGSVAGALVMVDPAYSPDNPGQTTPDGRAEHEITWQIANRMRGRLVALGARVVLSRGPFTSPSQSDRAQLANREDVEIIISVRLNGALSADARGAAAYYFGQDGYHSEQGRRLAQFCVDNVVAVTGTPNCRIHPSTSTLLRESRAPAVLVEPGFLTHPDEGRLLQGASHQNVVAQALVDAAVTFFVGDSSFGDAAEVANVVGEAS